MIGFLLLCNVLNDAHNINIVIKKDGGNTCMSHINEKILGFIIGPLKDKNKYGIEIDETTLNSFIQSKNVNETYGQQQNNSLGIIKKILMKHGKYDIYEYLARLAEIEPNLQKFQSGSRDHIVHSINTFFLGVYILEHINVGEHSLSWKLCGPTHDLGYPVEIANNMFLVEYFAKTNGIIDELNPQLYTRISPKMLKGCYPEGLNLLNNNKDSNILIQNRLNEWGLNFDIPKYYSWLENENIVDHGVIGALTELLIIDAIYQKHNPFRKTEDIIDEHNRLNYNQRIFDEDIIDSVSAIFIHNIKPKFRDMNKINYKKAPVAFLLFLCDTFQEWDRYSTNGNPKLDTLSGERFDIDCKKTSIDLATPNNELHDRIFKALNERLEGFVIRVDNIVAVK
jgi:hypothetical protein